MTDNINPDHYKKECSLECIESMELMFGYQAVYNFCVCNAWKYIWRWRNKNGLEDLNKADWYINRAYKYNPLCNKLGNHDILDRLSKYLSATIDQLIPAPVDIIEDEPTNEKTE